MKAESQATDPDALIASLDEPRRSHIAQLDRFIREAVPELERHVLKGMIGYGPFHYRTKSCEGDWFRVGLASNKASISIYACGVDKQGYIAERYRDRLPKASVGKSCIRFKKPEDVDFDVLREILAKAAKAEFGL